MNSPGIGSSRDAVRDRGPNLTVSHAAQRHRRMEHISWAGVGVAGLAVFIFGALWYGLIFGKLYRRELGVPAEPTGDGDTGPMPSFFIVQLAAALVMSLALAFLLGEDPTVGAGAIIGSSQ